MKISKEIYDKMVWCNNQSSKVMFITKIIEDYLTKKGVSPFNVTMHKIETFIY